MDIVNIFTVVSLLMNPIKTVYLQPIGNVDKTYMYVVEEILENRYKVVCVMLPAIQATPNILTKSKTRYDAQKIMDVHGKLTYTMFITEIDIAYKKSDKIPEWGILGLAQRNPGNYCVISTYRLQNVSKKLTMERLQKIALHEMGHCFGLAHCTKNDYCLMNAANGTIRQVDKETMHFCYYCLNFLKNKKIYNYEKH